MKLKKTLLIGLNALICGLVVSCSDMGMSNKEYKWELVDLGDEVDFHSELQQQYINKHYNTVGLYADGTQELSRPNAIRLDWSLNANNVEVENVNYELHLSLSEDFESYKIFETTQSHYDIYNLYLATEYYWRVNATLHDGKTFSSEIQSFKTTSKGPRNLYVEGVSNFRDVGGWSTPNGKRVKQGMLFRCGRLNESGSSSVVVEITSKGIDTALNELGIKSEIDLRRSDNNEVGCITSSVLGNSVSYYSYPMEFDTSNIIKDNIGSVKNFFKVLSDEANYPLAFHCNIGTDRTGMLAYLINGLMGVSQEDLYRDYLFSNFGYIYGSRNLTGIQSSYIAAINHYAGRTLSERINNYLVDLGIPQEHINSLIQIMSE